MKRQILSLLAAILGLANIATAQDISYFLYSPTDKPLFGGSTLDSTYATKEAFEAISFSFVGGRDPVYGFSSTPGTPGAAFFEPISVIVATDVVAYQRLLSSFVLKKVITDVNIEGVTQSGGNGYFVFSKMLFKNIVINTLEIEATQGDTLFVSMILDWESMSIQFFKQDNTGSAVPAGDPVLWNRTTNMPTF